MPKETDRHFSQPCRSLQRPDDGRLFKVTFGTGLSQKPATWKDRRELTWEQIITILTDHKEGPKDGPCMVPAIFREPERKQEYVEEISLLFFDSDCGHSIDEIIAKVTQHGYAAIIYSTHSHMTTTTTIGRLEYGRFEGSPEQYLIKKKHYLPRVAEGAKIINEDEKELTIAHQPCPKYRTVLPLEQPWKASDYENQSAANEAWRTLYRAAAHWLHLAIDPSCSDPNRLFFLPRHRNGESGETRVIEGSVFPICDIQAASEETRNEQEGQSPKKDHAGWAEGVIEAFNRKYSIESILERNDYIKQGPKYLAPTSSSKEPGVSIKDGRAFSHHQNDPLHTGEARRSHDAFGAFKILENGGNRKKALKAAASDLGMEAKHGQTQSQAFLLTELARDVTLFHCQDDRTFATISINGHRENLLLDGKTFRRWLTHRFYSNEGKPPSSKALEDAIRTLQAKARFEGECLSTFVRVGEANGKIYLDLCNDSWEAVEITTEGWSVVSDPPVKFRRLRGMLPLLYPVTGGSLEELKPFLNMPNPEAFLLVCGFLIQSLRPIGPYPVLNIEGEQGSGKSLAARILRSLVDPSSAPLRTTPRDERDLMIAANNSWILAFDNLSGVPNWLSDALCRLSTGGGFSTRELYTDSEEVIFDATRPQILTGIDRVSSRHDLVDRSIIVTLSHIPDTERKTEAELWQDFEAVAPRIVGALCDAVSMALKNISSANIDRRPRMADFALWVHASEPALPWEPGAFLSAYRGNLKEATELSVDDDLVASSIRQFMAGKEKWEGTASQLLEILSNNLDDKTKNLRSWPKQPNSLSRKLKRCATFLRNLGIGVDSKRDNTPERRRLIVLEDLSHEQSESTSHQKQIAKQHECSDPELHDLAGRDTRNRPVAAKPSNDRPAPDELSDAMVDMDDILKSHLKIKVRCVDCLHFVFDETQPRLGSCNCNPWNEREKQRAQYHHECESFSLSMDRILDEHV